MAVIIQGIDMPKKHYIKGYYITDDGKVLDVSRKNVVGKAVQIPSAQPERLTDDDFETIRIHLNAYKEKLCNQRRWEEAEEYQRIIDRLMAFASAEPERKKGEWIKIMEGNAYRDKCNQCGRLYPNAYGYNFCPNCGADMRKREGNNV